MTPIPGLLTWRTWANRSRSSNMCSMIAVEPTIPARSPDPWRAQLDLVSATDGRTHRVVERAYGNALAVRSGHCAAVCGHDVVLCALTTPPGPPCRRCAILP